MSPRDIWSPFSDHVLRTLSIATLIATVGRGAFLTLTVLYFVGTVGLTAVQVATVLTVANALGVASSLIVGHLSDRVSARRLQLIFVILQAAALMAYSQAGAFWTVLIIACLVSLTDRAANAARAAVIARAFSSSDRVRSRSILRTITNIGIALGSGLASIPLSLGTASAYRISFIVAACFTASSTILIARLPRSVDAEPLDRKSSPQLENVGRPPLRDSRYLLMTALAGVFAMQFGVFEVGVPQWITHHTAAPAVLVSAVLIVNAVLVIALQIPLSRGTDDVRRAGAVFGIAGVFMAAACVAYALAGTGGVATAAVLLVVAACAHTLAEILSSAGGWGLSFELADMRRAGSYQGVFAVGAALATMVAPTVVTATALRHGAIGWIVLGAVFLATSIGMYFLARRASLP